MPKYRRNQYIIKFLITLFNLLLFNYLIIYADRFQVSLDNLPVKASFLGTTASENVAVRLDNVIIDDSQHDGNITYVIKAGDSLSSIAQDVGTTVDNIRRVNGLSAGAEVSSNGSIVNKEKIVLRRLTISQLPGIIVAMDTTTSVAEFAKAYSLNEEDIKSLNNIADSKTVLRAGDELFLTISEKEAIKKGILDAPQVEQPQVAKDTSTPSVAKPAIAKANPSSPAVKPVAKASAKIIRAATNDIIDYDEGTILSSWFQKDKGYGGFAAGYCTSYAASRRKDIFDDPDRAFRGNAGKWYANAKAAGNKVGTTPKVGAIVVFAPGRGASSYGHVGIVEEVDVKNNKIIVSDMNYRGRNIVTKRVVDMDLPIGYVY